MKNIHIFPTNADSRIVRHKIQNTLTLLKLPNKSIHNNWYFEKVQIYITHKEDKSPGIYLQTKTGKTIFYEIGNQDLSPLFEKVIYSSDVAPNQSFVKSIPETILEDITFNNKEFIFIERVNSEAEKELLKKQQQTDTHKTMKNIHIVPVDSQRSLIYNVDKQIFNIPEKVNNFGSLGFKYCSVYITNDEVPAADDYCFVESTNNAARYRALTENHKKTAKKIIFTNNPAISSDGRTYPIYQRLIDYLIEFPKTQFMDCNNLIESIQTGAGFNVSTETLKQNVFTLNCGHPTEFAINSTTKIIKKTNAKTKPPVNCSFGIVLITSFNQKIKEDDWYIDEKQLIHRARVNSVFNPDCSRIIFTNHPSLRERVGDIPDELANILAENKHNYCVDVSKYEVIEWDLDSLKGKSLILAAATFREHWKTTEENSNGLAFKIGAEWMEKEIQANYFNRAFVKEIFDMAFKRGFNGTAEDLHDLENLFNESMSKFSK